MRSRLLLVLVVFALAAVAGFALPLLNTTADQRTQQLVISRSADLDRFAQLAQQAVDTGNAIVLKAEMMRYTEVYGDPLAVVGTVSGLSVRTGDLPEADPKVQAAISAAKRNQTSSPTATLRPWSSEPALFARTLGTGTRITGVVVLRASVDRAVSDLTFRWALIFAGALLAALVFVLLANWLANWVLRPLHRLEEGVLAVRRGRRVRVPASEGPAELRHLVNSFNEMSDAVHEAAEQQRSLVHDAAHQLRTPLTALRFRVDSLARKGHSGWPEAYPKLLSEVERLESTAASLTMLAAADSSATRMADGPAEDEPADLPSMVTERIDALGQQAERSGVKLECAVPAEMLLVRCSDSHLVQILDVLLDNAIKYGGAGATVRVGVERLPDPARVCLSVTDDGPGLSAQQRNQATQRFWRAKRPGEPQGTGVGLAIVARLVEVHRGRLRLEGADPHGLAVRVELLTAEASEEEGADR